MLEPAQLLIFVVILVLTILLVVLGVQVFFILKELRKTIQKTNKVLDDAELITQSIANPVTSLSSLIMGLKTGANMAGIVKKVTDVVGDFKEKDGK